MLLEEQSCWNVRIENARRAVDVRASARFPRGGACAREQIAVNTFAFFHLSFVASQPRQTVLVPSFPRVYI